MSSDTTIIIVAAMLLAFLYQLGLAPEQPAVAAAVVVPGDARQQFALDLLAALGNTQPAADTVAFVVEWTRAEDGGDGALNRNNPLNTTMCGYNMTGSINGDGACGVQTYATYQDGINATVATLAQANFSGITYALQTNDAAGAMQALIASPWASSHYGGGAGWPHVEIDIQHSSAPSSAVASTPISIDASGEFGYNIRAALSAQGGALQSFAIAPGETWSFDASIGPPGALGPLPVVGALPGGGWCDLAARYLQVARAFVPREGLYYLDHGIQLAGVAREDSITIELDSSGAPVGGQDLQITNTGTRPLHFAAQDIGGDQVQIVAWEG